MPLTTSNQPAGADGGEIVTILYENYRGETAPRRVILGARDEHAPTFWFGSTKWHPKPQQMFTARDADREVYRDFAMSGVKAWGEEAVSAALASTARAGAGDPVEEACKPWRFGAGDPPSDDSPLLGPYSAGIVYAIDRLAKITNAGEYVGADGSETFEGDVDGTILNVLRAAKLYDDEDGRFAFLSAVPASPILTGEEEDQGASSGPGCRPEGSSPQAVSPPISASIPRALPPIRLYEVETSMWGQTYVRPTSARSAASAKYQAYLAADLDMPFRDYQRHCRVRLYPGAPADDGYSYIRRAYGVDPRLGQRVTVEGEGAEWNGREGEIVYPNSSQQYVHVAFDHLKNPVVVHPLSIVFLTPAPGIEARQGGDNSVGSVEDESPTRREAPTPDSLQTQTGREGGA